MDENIFRETFGRYLRAVRRSRISRKQEPMSDEPDALVGTPVKPRPRLNSGAIALPKPNNPDTDQLLNS
jgi:hypothetical protein